MKDILENYLFEKLNLIKQIQDFLQDQPSEGEVNTQELLKQYAEYDFCAQNLRKIQRKYSKNWF